jgi:methyl-accepting chemotaxis protein
MKPVSLVRRVIFLAVGIALLVGIAFAAALVAILSLRHADARESRSKDVTAATLRIRAVSSDLDSALRGYVLSGDSRFLVLFNASRARVPKETGVLQGLVHDDIPQSRRSLRVRQQLHGYLLDYADNLITIAQISRSTARGQAAGEEDKRRTREIRATLSQILAVEDSRAQEASAHARSVTKVAIVVGVVSLAVSTALILLFGAWVARGVARPVRRLAGAAADVAGGDLSVRLDESGGAAEVGASCSPRTSSCGRASGTSATSSAWCRTSCAPPSPPCSDSRRSFCSATFRPTSSGDTWRSSTRRRVASRRWPGTSSTCSCSTAAR